MTRIPQNIAPAGSTRLLLATAGMSCVALLLGAYAVLRPPPIAAREAPEGLSAMREELAALRLSVEQTRRTAGPGSFATIAEVERRLARIEASPRLATAPVPTDSSDTSAAATPAATIERMDDGTPRYVALDAPNTAVAVQQLPNGALAVKNRDPALAGQFMVIRGRTSDGRDEDVTITVPPAS